MLGGCSVGRLSDCEKEVYREVASELSWTLAFGL